MISKVQRSPTTDSVRATEHVIVSICCQRIYEDFRTTSYTKLDSKLEVNRPQSSSNLDDPRVHARPIGSRTTTGICLELARFW